MKFEFSKGTAGRETFDRLHKMLNRDIIELEAALITGSARLGELGDLFVYLKFHAATCFHTEREIMLRHGFGGYDQHRNEHLHILEELRQILEQTVTGGATASQVTEAGKRALNVLRQHMASADAELIRLVAGETHQAAPVTRFTPAAKEPAFSGDLGYYTA